MPSDLVNIVKDTLHGGINYTILIKSSKLQVSPQEFDCHRTVGKISSLCENPHDRCCVPATRTDRDPLQSSEHPQIMLF